MWIIIYVFTFRNDIFITRVYFPKQYIEVLKVPTEGTVGVVFGWECFQRRFPDLIRQTVTVFPLFSLLVPGAV